MIRYALKCANDHGFESWFQSADAFDGLARAGHLNCPQCGDSQIEKSLMTPRVTASRKTAHALDGDTPPMQPMTAAPEPDVRQAIQTLRKHVEKTSDYVGDKFASEARAMHEGDMPHRPIYGEAKPEDAKKLIEDGVPALPLPFIPRQKTN